MLAKGQAYHCYCSKAELESMREQQQARKEKPRYDGRCRARLAPAAGITPVIRFANPQSGDVVVDDQVHGRTVFQNTELDDLIIQRSDGTPTYNFCVVVDDMDMGVTHVVRGDDHLNNTPRQINMLHALGATPPVYAHVPMILGADGAKLSKRHGAVSVLQYQEEGYLPDALLNYLVRLGWSHGDQEIFTRAEMIAAFDLQHLGKAAARFDGDKLLSLNAHHMMHAPVATLAVGLRAQLARLGIETNDQLMLEGVAEALRERAKTFKEMAANSVFFFRDFEQLEPKAAAKYLNAESAPLLQAIGEQLQSLVTWTAPAIHELINALAVKHGVGLGKFAQPLRVAVSGSGVSPPIDQTVQLLGRETVAARIARALVVARA
jgi:glutamyl-tRNA synthetase